jgi:hypothetical protein
VPTVRHCDVGGEQLDRDAGWWLVADVGRGWVASRGAACGRHAGQAPVVYPLTHRAADRYGAAVEAQMESRTANRPDREQRREQHARRVVALRAQRQRQPYRSLASTVDPFALVGAAKGARPQQSRE